MRIAISIPASDASRRLAGAGQEGGRRIGEQARTLAAWLAPPCRGDAGRDPNRRLLASMLAGQSLGLGCLPAGLGLNAADAAALSRDYFAGLPLPAAPPGVIAEKVPEWDELYALLWAERAGKQGSEGWMAAIVASACAGRDHLWQDLALADRGELSHLMQVNFPALAAANCGDMKWKKFLYRQLCTCEGIYVCPAPSCGECADYRRCFGPEE